MPLHGEKDRIQRIRDDLERIRACHERGDTTEARERLCALPVIATPHDDQAEEVGRLFFEFGFPEMAGRFWYIHDSPTEEMLAAVFRFEESCGGNPQLIDCALGPSWPRSARVLRNAWRLDELERDLDALRGKFDYRFVDQPKWVDRMWLIGCASVSFVVLFVLLMGIVFIASWFKEGV